MQQVATSSFTHFQADRTTLGADDGIGVATALALLDAPPSATLPPLEVCLVYTLCGDVSCTHYVGMCRVRIVWGCVVYALCIEQLTTY